MDEEGVLLVVEDGVVDEGVGDARHLLLQVARPLLGDPRPTLQPQCYSSNLGVKLALGGASIPKYSFGVEVTLGCLFITSLLVLWFCRGSLKS